MNIHFLSEALENLKKANQQLQKIDVENRDILYSLGGNNLTKLQ